MRQLILLTFFLCFSVALAQDTQPESVTIPFQGVLRTAAGQIVRDSVFTMNFALYADSVGLQPIWMETQEVTTRNGLFNTSLGSLSQFSLDNFGGPLYLETHIGNEPSQSSRIHLGSIAKAGTSQRIAGDIFTLPGTIKMFAPQPEPPGEPIMEMNTSIGGEASIHMFAPQPEPPGEPEDILLISSSPSSGASIRMFAPQPEPPGEPLLTMNTGPGGEASIYMFAPQPEPPGVDPMNLLAISSSPSNGATIRMFAPQPEPPGEPSFLVNTDLDGGASLQMTAVSGSNAEKLVDLKANLAGADMQLFAPQAGGTALVNNHPQIKMRCDSTVSSLLVQRARTIIGPIPYDSTGVQIKADSLVGTLSMFSGNAQQLNATATLSGGALSIFSNGSEYMGIDPVPFNGGGFLSMRNTAGLNSIQLSSEGAASFFDDGSEYMGIDPSPFHAGGDLVMNDSIGNNSMRFSSQGAASFFNDGSEYMGVEPSPFHAGGDLVMNDSTGDNSMVLSSQGLAKFYSSGAVYMGIDPATFNGTRGTLKMYSGFPILQTRVILSADGKLSLGTSSTSNILTIQQSSATDPIADAWTVYSSRRWKTNIQPIQNALDKVMRLNGVTYDWIENGKHDIGFIAEDVGKVVPEVVAYEDNGVDAKSVDYARLTSLLVEAVKEQQKEIELLKENNEKANQKIIRLEEDIINLTKK